MGGMSNIISTASRTCIAQLDHPLCTFSSRITCGLRCCDEVLIDTLDVLCGQDGGGSK